MLIRIFIGVHVFLVSCALPESFVRRQVFKSVGTSSDTRQKNLHVIHVNETIALVTSSCTSFVLFRFIVRIMCSVLGMHVRQKNPRSRDKNTKLYMCNHVTEFDHNIINLLTPCSTVSVGLLTPSFDKQRYTIRLLHASCVSLHLPACGNMSATCPLKILLHSVCVEVSQLSLKVLVSVVFIVLTSVLITSALSHLHVSVTFETVWKLPGWKYTMSCV